MCKSATPTNRFGRCCAERRQEIKNWASGKHGKRERERERERKFEKGRQTHKCIYHHRSMQC